MEMSYEVLRSDELVAIYRFTLKIGEQIGWQAGEFRRSLPPPDPAERDARIEAQKKKTPADKARCLPEGRKCAVARKF
jgi:hypothetical protein